MCHLLHVLTNMYKHVNLMKLVIIILTYTDGQVGSSDIPVTETETHTEMISFSKTDT